MKRLKTNLVIPLLAIVFVFGQKSRNDFTVFEASDLLQHDTVSIDTLADEIVSEPALLDVSRDVQQRK